MNKLALAAVATIAVGTAMSSTAYAGSNLNGPQLTGVALHSPESKYPVVIAVTLPSGETVKLNQSTIR